MKIFLIKLPSILILIIGQLFLSGELRAENELINFLEAEQAEHRLPTEAIHLSLMEKMTEQKIENLAIELDSIDITEMFYVEGSVIIYEPAEPLSIGIHRLRAVEYIDENTMVEIGSWSFDIQPSDQYDIAADTQLMANYRVADKNIGFPEPKKYQGQASTQVGFSKTSGNWRTEGQFDLFYDSNKQNRINGRTIENGEFLFSVANQHINARMGHHNVGVTSMVMNNFRRRGVSLEANIESINSALSGFSLSSTDISGFGHGLGISDPTQRVDGVVFESTPFSDNPELLYLSGTWLQGKRADQNLFVSEFAEPEDSISKGDAWAFSGQSALFDSKLQLQAEYAETNFDFNQSDDLQSDKDDAYSFSATFNDSTESGMSWNTGLSTQKIGTFFHSLGNESLASDQLRNNLFMGLQWGTYGVQASIDKLKDNVDKIDLIPRFETDLSNLSFNWSPTMDKTDTWLGTPSFSIGMADQDQKQTFTPVGFTFAIADNNIKNWQISANFAYTINSWGLGITNTEFRDRSLVQNDSDTISLSLFGSLNFGEDFTLTPSISFNEAEDLVTGLTSTSASYAVQSVWSIIPNEFQVAFDINLNQNQTSDLLVDGDNLSANLSAIWLVKEATTNSFGFQIDLSAAYNDFEDNIFISNSIEASQVFLTFTLTMPSRVGQE